MEERILKKNSSTKRSILFDMDKKFTALQNTLLLNTDLKRTEDLSEISALGSKLPIKTLEEFVNFDKSVTSDESKKSKTTLVSNLIVSSIVSAWFTEIIRTESSVRLSTVAVCVVFVP